MAQAGLLALLVLAMAMVASSFRISSVYDVLEEFGLPGGLLPPSVTSYTLSADGDFQVHLAEPTYCKFEDQVYYENKVTGKLSFGTIKNLSGIKAKQSFLWFPVTAIRVDAPYIYFDVGLLSKKLSLSLFETVPSCNSNGKIPLDFVTSLMSWMDKAATEDLNTLEDSHARHRKFAQGV
eukprot:TRINITY_DN908_c0_g3_i1.p1 TRINITY_DN908_c0_g3~~TRINITY_DN908_c0_g3_i1.p1  ORF type:complete len:179 (-),score=32.68 TRINITY_DN908_c0_g3_i1:423-959(-)